METSTSLAPVLEVEHLFKRFGSITVVKDISVRVAPGDVVGIIGANGAGKTTFVNIVTGYVRPSSGRIEFEGRSLVGTPPRKVVARGIARSFQVAQLFSDLTVLENLLLSVVSTSGGRSRLIRPLRGAARVMQADAYIEEFGLRSYRDAVAGECPQGVRKLVDIAMALSLRPRMLFLDEPTSGVSAGEKLELMNTAMRSAAKREMTVLFIEHDMEVVRRFASRVLAFVDGRLVADGPPDGVLRDRTVRQAVTGA